MKNSKKMIALAIVALVLLAVAGYFIVNLNSELQKEKDNNSLYTNVGKELARTNPTEYRRIAYGKPKTIGSFFDSVLSMFTP